MQTSANAASPFGSMAHNQHFYPSPSNPSPQISSKPLPGSSGVSMPNGIAHSPANHTSSPFFNNASPNGKASPMRGPSSPPKSSSEQPDTSQTTSHSSKRKKQRIEYVPWSKPAAESIGGFSLAVREQQVTQVQQRVRQRTVHDLGEQPSSVLFNVLLIKILLQGTSTFSPLSSPFNRACRPK